jgi:hypothetical protein
VSCIVTRDWLFLFWLWLFSAGTRRMPLQHFINVYAVFVLVRCGGYLHCTCMCHSTTVIADSRQSRCLGPCLEPQAWPMCGITTTVRRLASLYYGLTIKPWPSWIVRAPGGVFVLRFHVLSPNDMFLVPEGSWRLTQVEPYIVLSQLICCKHQQWNLPEPTAGCGQHQCSHTTCHHVFPPLAGPDAEG